VHFGAFWLPCALGRSGTRVLKREGDGATPRGRFALRCVLFRAQGARPRTALNLKAISHDAGWCDSPQDRNYNRPVRLPYPSSAEHLWRADRLYDVVVVLAYNERPRVRGRGSAIFMHVARGDFEPTEGCVALRAPDLRRLLSRLPARSEIVISV
jgi:L,D-peptidoglycan transpeptidase YkuD (ErfK/YbiS/YcfS/YnhG family)